MVWTLHKIIKINGNILASCHRLLHKNHQLYMEKIKKKKIENGGWLKLY